MKWLLQKICYIKVNIKCLSVFNISVITPCVVILGFGCHMVMELHKKSFPFLPLLPWILGEFSFEIPNL